MTDLTEQWKKGELISGKKYYITLFDGEPFEATFRTFEAIIPYWKFEANGRQYCDENGYDCVKVLAPVPSYDEYEQLENWNRFTADYHALREAKEIAEYEKVELVEKVKQLKERNDSLNNRDINLCRIANGIRDENFALRELLKECKQWFDWYHIDTGTGKEYIESWHKKGHEIHKKIDEVLKCGNIK